MSKLKPSPIQSYTKKCNDILQANIESRCAWFGLKSEEEISKRIGLKRSTYHLRKKDPSSWRRGELIMAAMALNVPLEWFETDHSVV